jgi:hypothetical protein
MKRLLTILAIAATVTTSAACSPAKGGLDIEPGSEVTLEKKDGVKVAGRLVEVKPEHVIVEKSDGQRTSVRRADIAAVRADTRVPAANLTPAAAAAAVGSTGAAAAPERPEAASADRADPDPRPAYREVTIPAGTTLAAELTTAVSSDTSGIEDPVRATLRRAVTIGGVQALPAGSTLLGHVTAAERSAKVKGRASVAFRFTSVDPRGDAERVSIQTAAVSRLAPATKKQDAAKIGGGAVGGAIIGGIVGGGDGAAKGAAIGGAAGTGVVLSTRGKEVRLGPGAAVTVRLTAPVTVRVPAR